LSKHSRLLLDGPQWRPANTLARPLIPRSLASWIYESGSLTARLRYSCGDAFNLQVLSQSWLSPFYDESQLLRLPGRRYALVREVLLCDGSQPLIMARSVMPPDVLKGSGCRLGQLGTRPLGEILFSYRELRRDRLDYAKLSAVDWLPEVAPLVRDEAVWGRRSLYRVAGGHVLVCEFFLSDVLLF